MARFRHVDLSPRLLPVDLESQLVPGTFAHALHRLIDSLDLSEFDQQYCNDDDGAPAIPPAILLKAVLLGYSQGLISSRAIERACRDNVLFIALTGDSKPHFTTLAGFIRRSGKAIAALFGQVLVVLDEAGLISREMFAVDGVKLPSNASKHRSGTRADFIARAEKLERTARSLLDRHQRRDETGDTDSDAQCEQRIARMQQRAQQLRTWLKKNPTDRMGTRGKPVQSNLTDNESAKLATDKGVVQGYCAVAVVDAAHQVIVEAQAHGTSAEQSLLIPLLDACVEQRTDTTLITADAGYHSEDTLAALHERGIDALIADNGMRQRDERFADQGKHRSKKDPLHNKQSKKTRSGLFSGDDFTVADDYSHALCPAGKKLYRNGGECTIGGYRAIRFRAPESACANCPLRAQCLRKPDTTKARQFAWIQRKQEAMYSQTMRERIDSPAGRRQYSRRMGAVEPVFGNIRYNKRLNRFTLRGRRKVDTQWKLFALVHNIEKLGRFGKAG